MATHYRALRGFHDVLPDEVVRWRFVEETARAHFARYQFREIRTPILEATELFARSVGASSDIVRKEMYTFDGGDEPISLRPENTASVVRAFVEHAGHRAVAAGYPERLFYIGPMFRRERPQKGRQRQFHQIGVEVLGAAEPLADAETIEMVDSFLAALGLDDRLLLLGSVGDAACRPRYREELKRWLEPHLPHLCADCRRRYDENPLRVFDCKVEADQARLSEAPTPLDLLCEGCREHFAGVRAALDASGVSHRVEPRLVRGLDYYERTVFEIVSTGLGAQNAILGGGRYDGLVAELGGPAMPGFGFAMGLERAVLLLGAGRGEAPRPDAALIALGAEGFRSAVALARRLRAAGLSVLVPLVERPLGAQLKRADRVRARHAVFVGGAELERGRYGVKDLGSGEQQDLDERGLIARLGGRG